jgi:hypothetical protein
MVFRPKNYRHKETALKGDPPSSRQQYYTFRPARRIPDHDVGAGPPSLAPTARPAEKAAATLDNYVTIGPKMGAFRYVDREQPVFYNPGGR